MTSQYDKRGIQFLYPENWKLIDHAEDATDQAHVVSLESSDGSATWAAHVYDPPVATDDLLKETIAALEETYEEVELHPIEQTIAGQSGSGVEAMFYCLDFLIKARLLIFQNADRSLLVWSQAEDRQFDQLDQVFQAISTSLLQARDA